MKARISKSDTLHKTPEFVSYTAAFSWLRKNVCNCLTGYTESHINCSGKDKIKGYEYKYNICGKCGNYVLNSFQVSHPDKAEYVYEDRFGELVEYLRE